MVKYNYYTQDGHLMQDGEIMWRICCSQSIPMLYPIRVVFNSTTGYNGHDFQKNPFAANHLHYFSKQKAINDLKKL